MKKTVSAANNHNVHILNLSPNSPVLESEFAASMSHCMASARQTDVRHIAIAVSGGSDSMALLALTHRWATQRNVCITALTVDHRLRPESSREAQLVKQWCALHDIPHHTLEWDYIHKPVNNVQAKARDMRYQKMSAWCRNHGAPLLLTAHTRDDQAETFLMRMERGCGIDGLSGISRVKSMPRLGITLIRPLLNIPKDRLRITLSNGDILWSEDPSNHSPNYHRSHIREQLQSADPQIVENIARTAHHAGMARNALDYYTRQHLRHQVFITNTGFARFSRYSFMASAPYEIIYRSINRLLSLVSGNMERPREQEALRLLDWLNDPLDLKGRTLHGCALIPSQRHGEEGIISIIRERAAIAPPLTIAPGETALWDNRFCVTLSKEANCAMTVRAPKELDITALRKVEWVHSRTPRKVLATLPALYDLEGLREIPHIGYEVACNDQKLLNVESVHGAVLAAPDFVY